MTAEAPATPPAYDPATLAAAAQVVRARAERCHFASDARRLNNAADEIDSLGKVA